MGRFIFNKTENFSQKPLDESTLRIKDNLANAPLENDMYRHTNAGFHPGNTRTISNPGSNQVNNQGNIPYLKAEINYMIDGFMRQLIDFQTFSNLDPEIQLEIKSRYPQFFE